MQVNANIEKMQGISGHADKNMLLSWLGSIEQKPKVVFVNHGHDTVCDEFAKSIENELEISALAPYSGDGFELGDVVTGCILQGKTLCLLLKHQRAVQTKI